ncbi:carbohydrate ABC transporter permease [Alicyclobacillus fodiniaquatilis]|uniref:Carbohydrate ABC transporter permease n=1 Tax=Alicyclobacillus fodiniaquatilis TaxID=1661150 RepID=A0ABW4JF27_9BACL
MTIRPAKIVGYIAVIIIAIFSIFPFVWMISTSLKPDAQLSASPPVWIPHPFVWKNWLNAVRDIPFPHYLWNTFYITGLSTLGAMLVNPMVAYSLARIQWFGQKWLFGLTIAVMMLPATVTMIPLYVEWTKVGLVGTPWPLILGNFLGSPFMIFLLRQFYLGLPTDLEDAGRIDGLSEYGIFFRIMLPLSMPGVLTVGLFQFMASWGDFMGPLIYLNKNSQYTISIGMQQFQTQHTVMMQELMVVALLTTIPIIAIYFFVQKRFIEGITFSGIKG